jgi:lanthionine synthetase-like protein
VLYRPEAFEPLADAPWNEEQVRDAIREIVADADQAFRPKRLWPADEWDAWKSPRPLKHLYVGAAGVLWALDRLQRRGYAESRVDLARAAQRTLEAWRENPGVLTTLEQPEPARASLLMGASGILTVLWRLEPSNGVSDELYARIRENVHNAANEIMWGSPGTMLAARAMFDWTGDERWADVWRESAAALLRSRDGEGLWTQRLYGELYRGLDPPHGVVGNVLALLRGGDLLSEESRRALAEETAAVLRRTAVVENGLANWPMREGDPLIASDGQIRVQWDAGAPGIMTSASSYLDEELLLAGAELTWRAGPPGLEKGPCICHGTAGNGYGFLKVFERTEDQRWLQRARRFAVHALDQVRRGREERGRGRYSLWTGDVGAALYAADCLECRTAYPIIDTWDW